MTTTELSAETRGQILDAAWHGEPARLAEPAVTA